VEAQLTKYRTLLDRMETCALDPDASRKFIEQLAQRP
jgi:hypothetical protein